MGRRARQLRTYTPSLRLQSLPGVLSSSTSADNDKDVEALGAARLLLGLYEVVGGGWGW